MGQERGCILNQLFIFGQTNTLRNSINFKQIKLNCGRYPLQFIIYWKWFESFNWLRAVDEIVILVAFQIWSSDITTHIRHPDVIQWYIENYMTLWRHTNLCCLHQKAGKYTLWRHTNLCCLHQKAGKYKWFPQRKGSCLQCKRLS